MSSTFCAACGASLPGDARFCPGCGAAATPGAAPAAASFRPPIAKRTSVMSIVALVLACIPACLINVVGIVLGVMALKEMDRDPSLQGRGYARAAVIVGSIMMVFTVLGVLAAIAIPNFIKFQARSKQSEARTNLRAVATAMEGAQGEVHSFAELQWAPGPRHRYSYFLADDVLPAELGGPYALPEDELPEGWRAAAVANVDQDDTLDVWVVEQDGTVAHLVDDLQQ